MNLTNQRFFLGALPKYWDATNPHLKNVRKRKHFKKLLMLKFRYIQRSMY